jgi:hypothetical protein
MAGERGRESGREWQARTWVVDAANVIGARPDRWWRDRMGAAARLYDRIRRLPAAGGRTGPVPLPERVVLVLEGAARGGVPAGTTRLAWAAQEPPGAAAGQAPDTVPGEQPQRPAEAPGGARSLTVVHAPGSGDDAVVEAARAAAPPVLVVTSDRGLRARLAAVGARAVGAGDFQALLDAVGDAPPDGPDRDGTPG